VGVDLGRKKRRRRSIHGFPIWYCRSTLLRPEANGRIRSNDLICTLDSGTIEDIYSGAGRLQNPPSDDLLLQAFMYYFRFDAFLPQIDAPDLPPAHIAIRNIDRTFYESLGPENLSKKCKRDGCNRGTISLSVLCRVHHFESVKGKPCPFDD